MPAVDVVVVGAGPAGVAASVALAGAGRDVLLVDKARFPRDKCCGDGLTTGALRQLEELGLDPTSLPSMEVVDPHAVPREEPGQAPEVGGVPCPHVVVGGDRPSRQPGGGASGSSPAPAVEQHQLPARFGIRHPPTEQLLLDGARPRRILRSSQQHHPVGLAQAAPGPVGGPVVGDVEDQPVRPLGPLQPLHQVAVAGVGQRRLGHALPEGGIDRAAGEPGDGPERGQGGSQALDEVLEHAGRR
jgi:glycine/D-amino acid oxidase-like deaminating enzyme